VRRAGDDADAGARWAEVTKVAVDEYSLRIETAGGSPAYSLSRGAKNFVVAHALVRALAPAAARPS
jgi:hypothetical protein